MKKTLLFMSVMAMALTQAQVNLVADLNPGSGNSIPQYVSGLSNRIVYHNEIYFAAYTPAYGIELWKSDGTDSGILVQNLATGFRDGGNQGFYYWQQTDEIYFTANGMAGTNPDYELFKYNGSSISAVANTNISTDGVPQKFIAFNNSLFFSTHGLIEGRELWITDGTASGTQIFKDIYSGSNSSNPDHFTVFNGNLFFSASSIDGRELWQSDGTVSGTNLVLNINPTDSNPESLTIFNNKLYFTADDGVNGRELWVTDGTAAGTQMVMDLYAGATGSNPQNLTVFNNLLCFTATHPTLGTELFKMTTLESVFNVKNISSGSNSSNPSSLHVFNGALYFSADDGTNGIELWSSTGFSSTTNMIKNINTSPSSPDSNPSGFQDYNGKLYFSANDGNNGTELWVTDGSNAGTVMVDDINSSGDSDPTDLVVANNYLFFSANDGSTGIELYKYYDPTLSTNDVELKSSIAMYPNPTSSLFAIETNQPITEVSIYDVQGKRVKSFSQTNASYNTEGLTSGIYFVNIKTDKGELTKKLIKQ